MMFGPPSPPVFVFHLWWHPMQPAAMNAVPAASLSQPAVTELMLAFQATSVPTIPLANRLPGHGDARNHDGV